MRGPSSASGASIDDSRLFVVRGTIVIGPNTPENEFHSELESLLRGIDTFEALWRDTASQRMPVVQEPHLTGVKTNGEVPRDDLVPD